MVNSPRTRVSPRANSGENPGFSFWAVAVGSCIRSLQDKSNGCKLFDQETEPVVAERFDDVECLPYGRNGIN